MFTVCPKCALTLVVTAADLRVAQGYVRCGRCSNVFNALARLSEDRQAAAAAAQTESPPAPAPKPIATPAQTATMRQLADPAANVKTRPMADPSATATMRQAVDPSSTSRPRQAPSPSPTPNLRQPPDAAPTPKPRLPQDPSSTSTQRKLPEPPARRPPAAQQPPPPPKPRAPVREATRSFDDDSIPPSALEFNPNATDITKVFVEQPPSDEFMAATGTFKAIRLEAEDSARAQTEEHFDPVDTQVDVEIDPDLLAAMAQLTSNRLAQLNPTPPFTPPAPPPQAIPAPAAQSTQIPTPPPAKAAAPQKATPVQKAPLPPAKQPPMMQPPMEQPAVPAAPMRLAERAKARADAARPETGRPSSLETTEAIRAALTPRKRQTSNETGSATGESPTSLFAGMWTAGSAVLVILLALQVIHHYRHDLAANESLNGPLTSLYAALGIPLVPRWNLGAYEVRQLGASTAAEAPGQITVRASVKNGAHQSQPLPLLRVTLQDRFGNRIAARDVPPRSYLPRAIPGSSLLSAGQRIDAEMAFVDPGSNAVGFEIDACLPAPGGGISCANDSAR